MKDQTTQEFQRELLLRIQTEGVLAAYEAALSICRDEKAPHPAKATASSTLFRVAGYFEQKDARGPEKQPHEMSADELAQEIRRLVGNVKPTPDDESIFD